MYDLTKPYDMCRLVNDFTHQQFGALAAHMSRTQTDQVTQREYVNSPRPLADLDFYGMLSADLNAPYDPDTESAFASTAYETYGDYR